jgi:hypothetical protein
LNPSCVHNGAEFDKAGLLSVLDGVVAAKWRGCVALKVLEKFQAADRRRVPGQGADRRLITGARITRSNQPGFNQMHFRESTPLLAAILDDTIEVSRYES